jgi:hypothetical protein
MALPHSNSALAQRLSRHFAACATVVASSTFLATGVASADVIYTPVNLVVPNNIDGLYINVETLTTGSSGASTAGWDINPYSATATSLNWFNATGTGMMRLPGVTTGSAGNLPIGTVVSATGSYGSGAVVVGAAAGNWQLNSLNRFGFRFIAADGQTHYGWGTFQIGASISGADRTITELAWESAPGVAISVGDTGAGSGPYDPCAATNPTAAVGSNNLFVRNTDIADLTTACGTIYKANYYKFTAPATRNYDFSTCAGASASSLVILDGCAAGSNVVACGTACGTSGSTVTLAATAGSVYYLVLGSSVSGVDLPSPYAVSVTPWYDPCDTANPTAGNGTSNLAYNSTTSEDLSTSCGVIYNANAYKYTPTESGSYTINTCSGGANTRIAVLDGCAANSAVLACNDDFCGGSSSVTLDLVATVPVYIVVGSNSAKSVLTGPVAVTVVPPPLPACVNAVAASYGANAFNNTASTTAQSAKSNAAGTTSATINKVMWFAFTPTATGQFKIDMCGASGDTIIAIGDVCPGVGGRFEGLAYNDDACAVGTTTSLLASCIDATNCGATGTFAGFPLAQDLVAGTTYYICAGSYSATANITGVLTITGPEGQGNPADLDGDGVVGPQDLATLLGNWGNPGAGDIDGDGQVGAPDLAALLGAWG